MIKEYNSDFDRFSNILTAPFCIYGAGIVATSIYTAIRGLYRKTPLFFLVSDAAEGRPDENPPEIDGIPVKRLSAWGRELEAARKKTKMQDMADRNRSDISGELSTVCLPDYYLVAAPETHHAAIAASLHSLLIEDSRICPISGELENQFMEAYYSSLPGCRTVNKLSAIKTEYAQETGAEVMKKPDDTAETAAEEAAAEPTAEPAAIIPCEADRTAVHPQGLMLTDTDILQVFQAKCHVDRPLQNPVQNPSYVYPIQVGADLTEQIISELRDNKGENISCKNRNYCELTATYYAWKNCRAAYKGLCHYRRIFEMDDGQMRELLNRRDEWDVILPYPSVHYPNISTQHFRYIKEEDWKAMLRALEETAPDYFAVYRQMAERGEQYFYNYNMLIARAEVFDDYCDFLFSVLERAEELTTPKGWERADRFAGYMGENLTTIYFRKNKDSLRIVYAGKKWLV